MPNYLLDADRNPYPVDDILEWAKGMKQSRRVALEQVGPWRVSTVFLGIDHRFAGDGPPILFETMVFGDGSWLEEYCERYATWAEAEAGHKVAVAWAEAKQREALGDGTPVDRQ